MCCNCEQCCLLQGSCAADLYRHPQLDADIEAVKDIYTDSAVSVRYSTDTHTQTQLLYNLFGSILCAVQYFFIYHTLYRGMTQIHCVLISARRCLAN